LPPGALLLAAVAAVLVFLVLVVGLRWHGRLSALAAIALAPLAVAALGYTLPPIKLAYRGLGELDVVLTHSFGLIFPGYLLQGGAWSDPLPWLLSVPLAVAGLPAITLAGIPDRDADRAAGKRTLVVRAGARNAHALAAVAVVSATGLALIWSVVSPLQ
jgi:1,4-dihydroxy-2-naphthoate octaprenyltransferase